MIEIRNSVRARLEKDELALGAYVRMGRTADVPKMFKHAGFDFIWLDLEHAVVPLSIGYEMALSAIDVGMTPLIRLSGHSPSEINLVLTNGFLGVIAPHVDTPEQAKAIAECCRFYPEGNRSVPNGFPHFQWASIPFPEAAGILNRETICIVMLETEEAIANADAIAAVPGVDVLKIGGSDLTFELGIPSEYGHPRMEAAVAAVIEACRKHGKYPGLGGVNENALVEKYVGMGMRYMSTGTDVGYMMAGAGQRSKFFRDLKLE